MVSEKFRRELRSESGKWRDAGLISAEQAGQLAQRYQFDQLEKEASRQFLSILLALGGILLGLGAITFVAANWQGMSPLVKVALLLGSLLTVNVVGFQLWNDARSQSKQLWGHALLLLGVLLLGANIGLLPQIFHQSGPLYGLFLLWGLGVLVMAAGLRLSSLAIAALILLMIAFFTDSGSRLSMLDNPQTWGESMIALMPLVLVGWFFPLARWCRSRWLFGLGAIALSWTIFSNATFYGGMMPAWLADSVALFLPVALLWSYDAQAWRLSWGRRATSQGLKPSDSPQLASQQPDPKLSAGDSSRLERRVVEDKLQSRFRMIARTLALVILALSLYYLSFHDLWRESWWRSDYIDGRFDGSRMAWFWLVDDILLIVLAKLGWIALLKQWPGLKQFQLRSLNSGMVAVLMTLPIMLLMWVGLVGALPVVAPFIINILLALMAIGLIRDGLALGMRSCFWLGMILLVGDIITRTFEYETELMFKALVFVLCGIGVLVAGVWFEKKSQVHGAAG